MLFLILQVARMRKFSYSGALVVCSPHTRMFLSRMTKNIKHAAVNVARTRGNFVDPTCHE
jgi:hypothetical protein